MPENIRDERLIELVRGYGHAIGGLAGGYADEWSDITHDDLSDTAIDRLFDDCADFLTSAEALHPEGKAGLDQIDIYYNLGWYFGSARMGMHHSFELIAPGPFGHALDQLMERVIKLDVALDDDRQIIFRN